MDLAGAIDQRHDLVEVPGSARRDGALVAAHAVPIHLLPRDAEAPGEVFRGLPHQQTNHRIGQPLEQADHWRQQWRWTQPGESGNLLADGFRLHHPGKPAHHHLGIEQRRM
jgi:hypothetical protein